jgi:hypothetical protein
MTQSRTQRRGSEVVLEPEQETRVEPTPARLDVQNVDPLDLHPSDGLTVANCGETEDVSLKITENG